MVAAPLITSRDKKEVENAVDTYEVRLLPTSRAAGESAGRAALARASAPPQRALFLARQTTRVPCCGAPARCRRRIGGWFAFNCAPVCGAEHFFVTHTALLVCALLPPIPTPLLPAERRSTTRALAATWRRARRSTRTW